MDYTRIILGLALVSVLSWIGCAENRASFFIQQVNIPSDDCVVDASEDGTYRTAGVLDVAFRDNYTLTPLVHNQLSPTAAPESLVVETNGIQISGANIHIWQGALPEGAMLTPEFYQPASSYVAPQGLTSSSFVVVPEIAIEALLRHVYGSDPNQLGFADLMGLDELITVGVTVLGITNGNQDVQTPEFYFPIRVCFGCLVYCPNESGDLENGIPLCENEDPPEGGTCLFGQDQSIDCRWCTPEYGGENCRSLCAN